VRADLTIVMTNNVNAKRLARMVTRRRGGRLAMPLLTFAPAASGTRELPAAQGRLFKDVAISCLTPTIGVFPTSPTLS
jgi:hypothetical protein